MGMMIIIYVGLDNIDVDFGWGQSGHVPPEIEKRLCFHQILQPFATNVLVSPNIFDK